MTDTNPRPAPFSLWALALGALALAAAMVALYAGPFGAQQSVGVSLGEMAGEVARSAMRDVLGREQPTPEVQAMTIDRWIAITVAVASVLALVLAVIGLARHEPGRMVGAAIGVSAAALAFQFFAWLALVILGAMIIVAVLHFAGDFFDFG